MKRQKGFTLIELLIVIAILGMLVAVVAPNVSQYLGRGRVEAANIEASTVRTAVMTYVADKDGVAPDSTDDVAEYFIGTLKGQYDIADDGDITGTGGWTGLIWSNGKWVKQ